jgi:hypothetical protein
MTKSRDPDRLIRAFLAEGQTDLPDQIYDAVRDRIEGTNQRVVVGPWRTPDMNRFLAFGAAAAVVVLGVFIGLQLFGGNVGGPGPTAQPSLTPTPSPSPSSSPSPAAFPSRGALSAGRHLFTVNGVPFTMQLSSSGWTSAGFAADIDGGSISKGQGITSANAWMPMWSLDGVYADPCGGVEAPPAGPSVEDLAAAFTTIPGTDATEPTDVMVGGLAAKLVAVTVPGDIGCAPNDFYLWYDGISCGGSDGPCGRYASALGSTTRIWIVEVDGTRLTFEAETYENAPPELEQEIQAMIDSIQFE